MNANCSDYKRITTASVGTVLVTEEVGDNTIYEIRDINLELRLGLYKNKQTNKKGYNNKRIDNKT